MSVAQYIDRKVDLAAFQGFSDQNSLLVQDLALPDRSGSVLTGLVKLGQRFLVELLTERGSMTFLPTRGSTFMTEARLGYIRTSQDLFSAFTRGLLDVSRSMRAEEQSTDREDERFGAAEILSVAYSGGSAVVHVKLSSLDPAAVLILPVNIVL